MGVRILKEGRQAVMYCSTSDWAFGPVFYDDDEHDAYERAHMFCQWLTKDPRQYNENELEQKYYEWHKQEATQWTAKKQAEETD